MNLDVSGKLSCRPQTLFLLTVQHHTALHSPHTSPETSDIFFLSHFTIICPPDMDIFSINRVFLLGGILLYCSVMSISSYFEVQNKFRNSGASQHGKKTPLLRCESSTSAILNMSETHSMLSEAGLWTELNANTTESFIICNPSEISVHHFHPIDFYFVFVLQGKRCVLRECTAGTNGYYFR